HAPDCYELYWNGSFGHPANTGSEKSTPDNSFFDRHRKHLHREFQLTARMNAPDKPLLNTVQPAASSSIPPHLACSPSLNTPVPRATAQPLSMPVPLHTAVDGRANRCLMPRSNQ